MSIDRSYRESHTSEGMGERYEEILANRIDAAIWDRLSSPRLSHLLRQERERGAMRQLDFACGTGRILRVVSQQFDDVTAVDISPEMLQLARPRFPKVDFYCGDVTADAALVPGKFDCMTAFRFFANAEPELRSEVAEWMSDHLAPGAALIGNTHSHVWSYTGMLNFVSTRALGRQRRTLSRAAMARLLSRYGLEVERWEGFRVLPTVGGRPLLGAAMQLQAERLAKRTGLGFFGVDQFFVARKRR